MAARTLSTLMGISHPVRATVPAVR
jgi:hypothetical protein